MNRPKEEKLYRFLDRSVTSLDRGGRFLIWSLRKWVLALHNSKCPCISIGPAFVRHEVTPALVPFHNTMLILNRSALEQLHFGSLACNRIHEHEALILSQLCAPHLPQARALKSTLAMIVAEGAVPALLASLVSLSQILHDAELLPDVSETP